MWKLKKNIVLGTNFTVLLVTVAMSCMSLECLILVVTCSAEFRNESPCKRAKQQWLMHSLVLNHEFACVCLLCDMSVYLFGLHSDWVVFWLNSAWVSLLTEG